MDENKEKKLDSEASDEVDKATVNENAEEIKDELEELAKTFQEELDKAKAQAKEVAENQSEEPEILIQELEDIPQQEAVTDDEDIPEEELCECCEEKRRGTEENPDSHYCQDCDKGLRHYPFEFLKVAFTVLVVCFAFFGCYEFANYSQVYVAVQEADALANEDKLYSAYDAYTEAQTLLVKNSVNAEMFYKRSIENLMKLGGMDAISAYSSHFKSWEVKLPHLRSVYDAFAFTEEYILTMNEIYGEMYQYESAAASEIPYDEIMAKIEAVEASTPVIDTTVEEGETTTTTPFGIETTQYCKPMISFLKFYLAAICERDLEEQIGYLEEIKNEYPEFTWLYATSLGDLYAKTSRDTTELCSLIKQVNAEDTLADVIEIKALRAIGNYDECVAKCKTMAENEDDYNLYEYYRQAALCYLIQGNYTAAYEGANSAYTIYGNSPQVCNTLALCSAAVGNEEVYTQMEALFKNSGMSLSDEVLSYKAGTMTLEQILLEGDFDV